MQPSYDRTTNVVEQTLGRSGPGSRIKTSDHYLSCRYDPFSPLPITVKIPDGRGKSVITRDYKTAYNLSLTDTDTLDIRISPCYPYPVRFHQRGASGAIVNGTALGVPNTTTPPPYDAGFIGGTPVDTAMSQSFSTLGTMTGETTSIIGARYVTLGYRLYYTGSAALCSGLVVADNINARITTNGINNPAYTQYSYSDTGTGANVSVAVNTAPAIVVDETPFEYSTAPTDQVVLRPENGLHGVLKMSKLASDHPFAPWYDTGAAVLISPIGSANTLYSVFSPTLGLTTAVNKRFGAFCWDDAFMETNIRLANVGQYRLEIIACLEMELAMNSSLLDLARPSPIYNQPALNRDMLINSMVVPAPFSRPPIAMDQFTGPGGGRQRVRNPRRTNASNLPPKPKANKPKATGRAARRRRNRQRRAAKRMA